MTLSVVQARLPAALPLRLTAGTVGTGPKARDEVAGPHGLVAPGVLASDPTGYEWTCIASDSLLRFTSLCRVGRWRLRPVLKHGPRSLTCMRAIGLTKPSGAVKAKSCLQLEGRRANRSPAISNQPRFVGNTQSIDVGTRKMVNYAWPG
jgi:hypothetical protein